MQQIASPKQQRKQVKQRRKHFNNNTERTAPNPNDVLIPLTASLFKTAPTTTRTTNEWNHATANPLNRRNDKNSLCIFHFKDHEEILNAREIVRAQHQNAFHTFRKAFHSTINEEPDAMMP
ncbi:736_t:CDS:2, partial [Dentiscutata erythropus]